MDKIKRSIAFYKEELKKLDNLKNNSRSITGIHLGRSELIGLMIEYFSKNDLNLLLKK
jgi:hypothetical protein